MEPMVIELGKFFKGDGVLAGQDNGKLIRERFKLDEVDALPDDEVPTSGVRVVIPESVYSFNSSFFLGMLSPSVNKLGPAEFRRRYHFEGPDAERTKENGIRVSLLTGAPFLSLKRTA